MDQLIILSCSCLSFVFVFCSLTNQGNVNIYNVVPTVMEEQIWVKINHKGVQDESPSCGLGFDFICGIVAAMPATWQLCLLCGRNDGKFCA